MRALTMDDKEHVRGLKCYKDDALGLSRSNARRMRTLEW